MSTRKGQAKPALGTAFATAIRFGGSTFQKPFPDMATPVPSLLAPASHLV